MMQAASDIFLGWTEGVDTTRHFYWRQLRDMKGSIDVENLFLEGLLVYARMCGLTLARAHARSGDAVAIANYLGKTETWDRAVGEFASRYADQNERDYQAMLAAVKFGTARGDARTLICDAHVDGSGLFRNAARNHAARSRRP